MAIFIGDDHTETFSFTLLGTATPADPDRVLVIHRKPDLTETVYEFGVDPEVTNPEVGEYLFTINLTDYRRHYFRPVGTGTVNKASETFVDVEESHYLDPLPD